MKSCPTCGSKIKTYRHRLNTGLLSGLKELKRVGGVAKLSEMNLTKNEFNNFQKLQYFGLVKKEFLDGEPTSRWMLTGLGRLFLDGLAPAPQWSETLRNSVVNCSPTMVYIFDVKVRRYQKRADYLEEHDSP